MLLSLSRLPKQRPLVLLLIKQQQQQNNKIKSYPLLLCRSFASQRQITNGSVKEKGVSDVVNGSYSSPTPPPTTAMYNNNETNERAMEEEEATATKDDDTLPNNTQIIRRDGCVALLLDAENVHASAFPLVLDYLQTPWHKFTIRRIYGKSALLLSPLWQQLIREYSFVPHHSSTPSADVELIVDTMDLLHDNTDIETFVIMTSDGDFTRLIQRLRESNKAVIGVGERQKSNETIHKACDKYVFTEDLLQAQEDHLQAEKDRIEELAKQEEEEARLEQEEEEKWKRLQAKKAQEAQKRIEERKRNESRSVTAILTSWQKSIIARFRSGPATDKTIETKQAAAAKAKQEAVGIKDKRNEAEQANKERVEERKHNESRSVTDMLTSWQVSIASLWNGTPSSGTDPIATETKSATVKPASTKAEKGRAKEEKDTTSTLVHGLEEEDFDQLRTSVQECVSKAGGWANLGLVAQTAGIDHRKYGFTRFKELIEAMPDEVFAVKSNYVKYTANGSQ